MGEEDRTKDDSLRRGFLAMKRDGRGRGLTEWQSGGHMKTEGGGFRAMVVLWRRFMNGCDPLPGELNPGREKQVTALRKKNQKK